MITIISIPILIAVICKRADGVHNAGAAALAVRRRAGSAAAADGHLPCLCSARSRHIARPTKAQLTGRRGDRWPGRRDGAPARSHKGGTGSRRSINAPRGARLNGRPAALSPISATVPRRHRPPRRLNGTGRLPNRSPHLSNAQSHAARCEECRVCRGCRPWWRGGERRAGGGALGGASLLPARPGPLPIMTAGRAASAAAGRR